MLLRAIYGSNRLKETTTDFFRNHFNVDIDKGELRYYVGEYEREVLRANVLGDFGDMLLHSAKHPAMLVYLDNALSRRPPTKQELREIERRVRRQTGSRERATESVEIARQRGLNENYARELLELHTLGVDKHYTQHDIIEVAKVLTGWTVQTRPEKPVTFRFRADMHVPGDKRILGALVRKDRDNPVTEGERVIEGLVKHSGTARFWPGSCAGTSSPTTHRRRWWSRIAKVFQKSEGHLPTVYQAIFEDRDFFAPEFFQCKFKRPFEFVVSALRVTGADVTSTVALLRALTGHQRTDLRVRGPDGLLRPGRGLERPRASWPCAGSSSRTSCWGSVKGVRMPDSFYDDLHPTIPRVWKDQLARRVLAVRMSPQTSAAIDRMVQRHLEESPVPKTAVLAPRILGMLLGSPEFQRQ